MGSANTTWHTANAAVKVSEHGLYEPTNVTPIGYALRKQHSTNMTSTTTTISETNPPSETIRLAAAYDDKTHEGVGFPMIPC